MLRNSFLILLLCVSFYACAQDITRAKSLIWRISGNGLSKPSYLFGTIHLICPADYIWTSVMEQSFRQSDRLCMEMNLNDASIMMQVAVAMIDKSGKNLKDYFTETQYKKLEKYFTQSVGMDLAPFQHLKPIALQSMMTEKSSGCSDPVSYEDSLMHMAKTAGKSLDGLEQPSEQIAALDTIPTDSVISDIMQSLDDTLGIDSQYTAMVAYYKIQDLPGLYRTITSSNGLDGEMGPLLNDRNARWVSRIQERIRTNSVFFAVGAGHLWGDKGLITLLRKEGYRVEPVH